MLGNQLVNVQGQAVQLHGVNRSGTEYACVQGHGIFDGPSDNASLVAIRSWGANAVRVPLNEDCWLGINGVTPAYSGPTYQQAIQDYVNLLVQNDLYPIVELHWSAPGTTLATWQEPMPDRDHSPALWSEVATAFKGNDTVIFDLFNEPFPDSNQDSAAGWICWRDGGTCPGVSFDAAGMQTLVDAVRATGATNVIALGGIQFSNALTQWLTYKPNDPLNNLAAAWHVYNFSWCNTVACFDANAGAAATAVPILADEVGTDSCDATFFNDLLAWLDTHQQSYLAWTWDTWGTDCAAKTLISDYAGTPTTYGQIYKAHLATLR